MARYNPAVRDPIPPGWFGCPNIGEVSELHNLIPMKVPLGNSYKNPNMLARTQGQWSPLAALHEAHALITAKNKEGQIGMVLDLSNSDKYYDPAEFTAANVRYAKVPCRGRGVSPEPLAVNMAVWEIRKALALNPNFYVLVHCTHGFNRSGFIIVCACMRLLAASGYCAAQRAPPKAVLTPALPEWKPADDEDEDERLGYSGVGLPAGGAAAAPSGRLSHSDKIGEPVCVEEARWVVNTVYDIIQGQDNLLRGIPLRGFPHASMAGRPPGDLVIGSQPVSLALDNLDLVRTKRYFVTWKADGTRYLLLLLREGAYLIDRAGEVRRAHMRFPTLLPPPKDPRAPRHPVGPPHHWTLLDGEMVVDDLHLSGDAQRRRYLVYDALLLGGEGIADLRFSDRYQIIDREVERPRKQEVEFYRKHPVPTFLYDWGLELFSVRRKEFWPLYKARKLLSAFIPGLCHESDGLILQPWDDPYIPRTYPHLLKWKFRHMNSVDFKLHALPGAAPRLALNCAMRRKHGAAEVNHLTLQDIGLGEQRVEFPDGVDPTSLHGKIIECSFDVDARLWTYMRDRPDKLTANHRSVFDKVMTSITDNITEEVLLSVFDEALQLPIYNTERDWISQPPPAPQPSGGAAADAAGAAQRPGAAAGPPPPAQQGQRGPPPRDGVVAAARGATPDQLRVQRELGPPTRRGPSPILTPPPGATAEDEAAAANGGYDAGGSPAVVHDLRASDGDDDEPPGGELGDELGDAAMADGGGGEGDDAGMLDGGGGEADYEPGDEDYQVTEAGAEAGGDEGEDEGMEA
ncbi:Rngtt [Scenedesmus sp. PABB004]|nr:Rngtt [Scenedesmus sp. PABB004]